MYSFKKINDVVIKPIPVHHPDINKIKGHKLIPQLYSIIFACGKKGSGKTNVVFKLLEECTNKDTKIVVFASTIHSDKNWLKIKEWIEKRGQPAVFYTSIFEDGVSNIEMLVEKIKGDHAEEEEANKKGPKTVKKPFDLFGDGDEEKIPNTKKPKLEAPDYFIILDDISGELRVKKDVQLLLKHMRHLRSKVVISSQYPGDLDPASRGQVDFWCIFKGFGKEKMEEVFPQLDMRDMEFEEFYKVYLDVTADAHSFLYIDRNNNKLRKNFNLEILMPHHTKIT